MPQFQQPADHHVLIVATSEALGERLAAPFVAAGMTTGLLRDPAAVRGVIEKGDCDLVLLALDPKTDNVAVLTAIRAVVKVRCIHPCFDGWRQRQIQPNVNSAAVSTPVLGAGDKWPSLRSTKKGWDGKTFPANCGTQVTLDGDAYDLHGGGTGDMIVHPADASSNYA